MKIIAWNIAHKKDAWRHLLDTDADIALLSEASAPPDDVAGKLDVDPAPWHTTSTDSNCRWRTAVVKLSNKVEVEWITAKSLADAASGELAVSREGTLSAAIVTPREGDPLVVASMYAAWERYAARESLHNTTSRGWIYADASVHRLISDLSAFVGTQKKHRILAAGDLNILNGYGDHRSSYWESRYATVFQRMAALNLPFVGPQAPDGRQADPWPKELPAKSKNVPTFRTSRKKPETATRQLDFVFASVGLVKDVRVSALNDPEHWGPSDHCRIEIEVDCDQ